MSVLRKGAAEKASFCLTCFSPLNAPIPISEEKGKSGFVPFLFSHRRALSIMAGVLAAVLTLTTLLYRPNTEPPSEGLPPIGNSTTTEDTAENTTRKENIWDQISNLFRPDKEETNPSGNDDLREEETKPQFTFPHFTLPNIFGSDESESTLSTNTTASATVPSTVTVPEAEKPTAPPTTEPEAPPQIEPQMWEYEAYPSTGNQITLTKYNGKAKHIVIPEKIDGKYVRGLKKGAIQNIPQTAKISLEDGKFPDYVTFNDGCIQNMPNLVSVDFPGCGNPHVDEFRRRLL